MKYLILALTGLLALADEDVAQYRERFTPLTTLARQERLNLSTRPLPWEALVRDPVIQANVGRDPAIYFQAGYAVASHEGLELERPFCKLSLSNAAPVRRGVPLGLWGEFGVGRVTRRLVPAPDGSPSQWTETDLRIDTAASYIVPFGFEDKGQLQAAFYSLECKAPMELTPAALAEITGLLVYVHRPLIPDRLLAGPQVSDEGLEARSVQWSAPVEPGARRFVTLAPVTPAR